MNCPDKPSVGSNMPSPPQRKPSHRLAPAWLAAGLLLAALPVRAEELGRLFFTPERRAALERQRLLEAPGAPKGKTATRSVQGIVLRSGGGTTTWRDGVPQYEEAAAGPRRVEMARGNPGEPTTRAGLAGQNRRP